MFPSLQVNSHNDHVLLLITRRYLLTTHLFLGIVGLGSIIRSSCSRYVYFVTIATSDVNIKFFVVLDIESKNPISIRILVHSGI